MSPLFTRLIAACGIALAGASGALAQERFPSRPVTLTIPLAAGSAMDGVARIVGEGLAQQLGQPVIAVNRPGGNNMVAVRSALANPADGYNLLFLGPGVAIEQVIKKDAQFDVRRDLIPVARVVQAPLGVFVSNSLPVNSMGELVEYARKNPGKVNFASAGIASIGHLVTERLMAATATKMVHVPYAAGTPTVLPAMLAGDVGVYITEMYSLKPFVAEGKLKLIATLGDRRSPIYTEVPAIPDLGMPELRGVFWPFFMGLFVEPRVSPARVELLAAALNKAVAQPSVQSRLVSLGYDPVLLGGTTPAEFRAFILDELARNEATVRAAGIPTLQ